MTISRILYICVEMSTISVSFSIRFLYYNPNKKIWKESFLFRENEQKKKEDYVLLSPIL